MSIYPAGVQQTNSGLTGSERVDIDNGGAVKGSTTTAAIAALAGTTSSVDVVTTLATVGAGSITAAALVGRDINRTGIQTAAFTDTTVSADTIIAALPSGAAVGTSWLVRISNNQTGAAGYVETVAGGTGVTVSGITTIPTGATAEYLVTYSAASTITMVGRFIANSTSTVMALAGSTSGQTQVTATAAAGATVQTLPPVTGTTASTSGTNLYIADVYRTTAPVTKNANVTPATVTGLSGAVAVGTYKFRAYLPSTVASGTGGIAYSFLLTTAVLGVMECSGAGYTASAVAVQHTTTATSGTALFTQAAVVIETLLEGTFTVTTAGTFAIQMCQNTSNASDTVALVGGYLELIRIA